MMMVMMMVMMWKDSLAISQVSFSILRLLLTICFHLKHPSHPIHIDLYNFSYVQYQPQPKFLPPQAFCQPEFCLGESTRPFPAAARQWGYSPEGGSQVSWYWSLIGNDIQQSIALIIAYINMQKLVPSLKLQFGKVDLSFQGSYCCLWALPAWPQRIAGIILHSQETFKSNHQLYTAVQNMPLTTKISVVRHEASQEQWSHI